MDQRLYERGYDNGLLAGRAESEQLKTLARALIDHDAPMADGNDCRYCRLNIAYGREADPHEHKSTCVWARLCRALLGHDVDTGVVP